MNKIFAISDIGRKNIIFGIALFALLGVMVGIPLTIDFLGGSLLGSDQYQTWKVVHGYGVFLSFINFFFGLCVDRLSLSRQQKEAASWAFLLAGLFGGVIRMALVMLSSLDAWGLYVSLVESALFIFGTFIVLRGLAQPVAGRTPERTAHVRSV